MAAITYDYRGTGGSRPASLSGYSANVLDWMDKDVPSVTAWTARRFPCIPLFAVGHSVGGHAIGLTSGRGLQAAVLIASHAGVTATIQGAWERLRVRLVVGVLAPLMCRIFGYMPSKRLGLGQDLPAGVMAQWLKWMRMPGYFFDDPDVLADGRFGLVRVPLLVMGFSDDPWANPTAIDLLAKYFTGVAIERRSVSPAEAGTSSIGHMGFFRLTDDSQIWMDVIAWLKSHVSRASEPVTSADSI